MRSPNYYRRGSIARSSDSVLVTGQMISLAEADAEYSHLEWWMGEGQQIAMIDVNWPAMDVLARTFEENGLLWVLGDRGQVMRFDINTETEHEEILFPDSMAYRGKVLSGTQINGIPYAVGMDRQVYRRDMENDAWQELAADIKPTFDPDNLQAYGFTAISGSSPDNIYCVGYSGEIWHYDGSEWYQCPSPTNLVLHDVTVISPTEVYIVGQEGLLFKGARDQWERVDSGDVDDADLWGCAWFNEALWVTTDSGIFRYDSDAGECVEVDVDLEEVSTFMHLDVNDGAMWCFGQRDIVSTEDGINWVDRTFHNWEGD